MSVWPALTMEDAARVDPVLVRMLAEGSPDFFEPRSSHVMLRADTKPLTGGREVRLITNQLVSRAWHAVFIKAFAGVVLERYGRWAERPYYKITEQVLRPGPVEVAVDLGSYEEERREIVEVANVAVETANALASEGWEHCRRRHNNFSAELGLRQRPVGFGT